MNYIPLIILLAFTIVIVIIALIVVTILYTGSKKQVEIHLQKLQAEEEAKLPPKKKYIANHPAKKNRSFGVLGEDYYNNRKIVRVLKPTDNIEAIKKDLFYLTIEFKNANDKTKFIEHPIINKPVENVIVINLKRRPDRKESFKNHFPWDLGNVEFFEAVDGKELDGSHLDDIKKIIHPQNNFRYQASVTACILSHYRVWKKIVESGKNTLVFEDDVWFYHDSVDQWNKMASNTPDDFDMIYMGQGGPDYLEDDKYSHLFSKKHSRVPLVNEYFFDLSKQYQDVKNEDVQAEEFFTGLAIFYSPKGAQKLIDYVEANPFTCAYDSFLVRIWSKVNSYALKHWIAYTTTFLDSDIQFDYTQITF